MPESYNFTLFNVLTEAIKVIDELRAQLTETQQQAEEVYMSRPE